jgi:hypothetical protein
LDIEDRTEEAVMRRLAVLLSAVILAILAPLAPLAPVVPGCAAAVSDHAALVVEHGDGSVVTRCVAFSADTISGEELLNQSGVAWSSQAFGGFGDAVCALDGEPAHYVDCLGKDNYWALFVSRRGGPWQLSSVGISTLKLADGDAEGFKYVPDAGTLAPPVLPSGVCPAAATPTPLATNTTAAAAATESPAASTPTATPAPVESFVATATIAPSPRPPGPNPAPPGGIDPGLILAVGVGGGLAVLTILRLVLTRRPSP